MFNRSEMLYTCLVLGGADRKAALPLGAARGAMPEVGRPDTSDRLHRAELRDHPGTSLSLSPFLSVLCVLCVFSLFGLFFQKRQKSINLIFYQSQ